MMYDENITLAKLDEEKFGKALIYILSYLVDNMNDTGKIVISSKICRAEYYDKSICITITGIGCKLPDTELQRLFDPLMLKKAT
jgi:hypothetical protein